MNACSVFGHRYRFRADGPTLIWTCERGCGVGGEKTYPSADRAQRYADAFDRRDDAELGRRAPLLGLLPLRVWRRMRENRDGHGS